MTDKHESGTTEEDRDEWRLRAVFVPYPHMTHIPIPNAKLIALLDDADAADALRAQVAALQAENEQFFRDTNTQMLVQQSTIRDLESTIKSLEAELAAAQAKLAVPVPSDVRAILDCVRDYDRSNDSAIDQLCDAAESLARDNAALRTKAEALERERDGLRETLQLIVDLAYDRWQQPDGKLMTHVDNAGQRCWIIAAGVLDEARAALAEKP